MLSHNARKLLTLLLPPLLLQAGVLMLGHNARKLLTLLLPPYHRLHLLW